LPETVSIVNIAVFVGVKASTAVDVGTNLKVYVPFAHTAVPVIPPHDTVTVPTVHAEMVKVQIYSL